MRRTLALLTTCLTTWLAACSVTGESTADLILINGDVYTVDEAAPRVEAFAIKDGKFIAVGSNDKIQALAHDQTIIIDAGGKTVTPGFIDGHAHVSGDSPVVVGVDLSYVAEKAEWLRLIAEADQRLPVGEWMVGGGWDHTISDGEFPTKTMLDDIVPERPVLLKHIDFHYAWANSHALDLAGITADTPVPAGGEILLDPNTGEPNGILLEGAQELVEQVIPVRSAEQRHAGLVAMQQYANSFGLTGLHQMGELEDYLYIVENGNPTLRIWYGQWGRDVTDEDNNIDVNAISSQQENAAARVEATGKEVKVGPLLRLGYVKLMNDGVLSAHTAVLLEAYQDRAGWRGEYLTPPAGLAAQVRKLAAAGFPVAIHSIGDAAVRAALDAFAAARDIEVPYPNRIEHIELVHPDDIARFRQLGVAASMQPNHGTNSIGYVPDRVGQLRESRAYVWKSMLDSGVMLVFGADYPTSPLNPLIQIADAVFRKSPFGFNEDNPWHPEQAVSFEQALHAYTQAGADMTPWKAQIGSITPGKWADFVLLDGKVPVPIDERFRALAVEATYFAGREVYAKPH